MGLVLLVALSTIGCTWVPLSQSEAAYYRTLLDDALIPDEDGLGDRICRRHHIETELREVPIVDGLCIDPPRYPRARVRQFPNSFLYVLSCLCEGQSLYNVERRVCPKCRQADIVWHRRHDYTWPEPYRF